MKWISSIRFSFVTKVLIGFTLFFSYSSFSATFILQNADGPNEGLNDTRAVSPIGANTGTTLGVQRQNLLEAAFDVLENTIESDEPIRVSVSFDPLECDEFSAVLGGAAPVAVAWNFAGAPEPDVLYPIALANQHTAQDLDPGFADIELIINSSVDNNDSCLTQTNYYYGLDGAEPTGTLNLFSTVLHELIHGLGFLSFVDIDGNFLFGLKDQFSQYIYDIYYDKYWPELTQSQRLDSFDNTDSVVWRAPEIVHHFQEVNGTQPVEQLFNGLELEAMQLYAPSPIQPASSISHWREDITPRQLMEPFVGSPPIVTISDYERAALFDIGWQLTQPLPFVDRDGDGVQDRDDHFIWDPDESADNDLDRFGDNKDPDDDNDGMDDQWELSVGLDKFVANANEDPDGDGRTNVEEYAARTNPLSSQSVPEVLDFYYEDFSDSLPASWYSLSVYDPNQYYLQPPNIWFVQDGVLNATPPNYLREDYTIQFGALFPAGAQVRLSLDNPAGCDIFVSIFVKNPVSGVETRVHYSAELSDDIHFEVPEGISIIKLLASNWRGWTTPECNPDLPVTIDDFYVLTQGHDQDGDGISDLDELDNGLDLLNPDDASLDADSDGLSNLEEFGYSTGVNNQDSDGDGLLDGEEVNIHSSNPLSVDTDNDGMLDAWEAAHNLRLNDGSDTTEDLDGDGVTNYDEYLAGTNPDDSDSKPFNISVYAENFEDDSYLELWKPTPNMSSFVPIDSDSFSGLKSIQSISDEHSEINIIAEFSEGFLSFMLNIDAKKFFLLIDGTPALNLDNTTHDNWTPVSYFVPAGVHRFSFTNRDPSYVELSCDQNDLACRLEALRNQLNNGPGIVSLDTVKFVAAVNDSDADGMSDAFENDYGLDVATNDASLDLDGDGFSNLAEFLADTRPNDPISFPASTLPLEGDADGDSLNDEDEVNIHGTAPENRDSDGDLMPDDWELQYGFNPLDPADANQDQDGDGSSNLEEFGENTNPLLNTSTPADSSWNTYQGNAQHTGYVPITINPDEPSELWSKTVFDGTALHPVATFDGTVFVSSQIHHGTQTLAAFNSINGTELWQHDFGNIQWVSGPAVAEGKVFVQTGGHSDTYLYGFDQDSGNVQIQSIFGNQWTQFIAPTPYDSDIYIQGGYYGGAYSFNSATGEQNWFNNDHALSLPAVNDSQVFVCGGGELEALNRQTGLKAYGIPLDSCYVSPVIGDDDNALVIGLGDLVSLDLTEQTIKWLRRSDFTGMPVYGLGLVAAIDDGHLAVHNEKDGALLWKWAPPTQTLSGNPVLTNSHIFVSTSDTTYAINLQTHLQEWSYDRGGHLVISEETLFISSSDGRLTAITLLDSDGDGMADGWEIEYGLDPENSADATDDLDGDNLTNLQEYQHFSNPTLADSDADTLSDYDEIMVHGTNPIKHDTDSDGMPDNWELNNGLDPLNSSDAAMDADGDGLTNLEEQGHGSNPRIPDTDGDGMEDGWETEYGLAPLDPTDATNDPDTDGLTNLEEFQKGSNPTLVDSDGDNLTDYDEVVNYGTNPSAIDSDRDDVDDGFEIAYGLNPLIQDSDSDPDADGFSNLEEFITNNDPSDTNDKPVEPNLTLGDQLCSFNANADTISIHPQSDKVYVPNSATSTIDVITVTRVGCLSRSIPVVGTPRDIAFNEDGSKFYATISSAQELHVYDSATDQLNKIIPLPAIGYEVVAGGGTIYVSAFNTSQGIMRINAETEAYIDSFELGVYTYFRGALELSPNGERLFFANRGISYGTLAVYDVSGDSPILLHKNPYGALGGYGEAVAVDPINGSFVSYAVSGGNGEYDICKMRGDDFIILGGFTTGPYPRVIEYSHNSKHAYTVNASNEIKVWDSIQFVLETILPVSGQPKDIVESWSQRYIVATTGNSVQVLHVRKNSDGDRIPDEWESKYGLDPENPADAVLDADSDGLSNLDEYFLGTTPNDSDSDKDGVDDGLEREYGTDPNDPEDCPAWACKPKSSWRYRLMLP